MKEIKSCCATQTADEICW